MVLKNFCLLFVFLSLSINANAQMTHEIGGIWYNLYPGGYMYYTGCVMEDNTAEVVGLYQDFDKVYIPSEVTLGNTIFTVKTIGSNAFKDSSVEYIHIPPSVNSIMSGAFAGCKSLTSINVPENLINIYSNAFDDSGWYDAQNEGLLFFGNWLLGYKGTGRPKESLSIPEGTIGVAAGAFENLLDLIDVTMSNTVKYICSDAFEGCKNLGCLYLSNNLISLGGFRDCSGLSSITIPNSVTTIDVCAFEGCSGLTSITIPNSVTYIGMEAFRNCTGLTSVIIGSNVTFDENVFTDTDNLMSVTSYITRPSDLPTYKQPFFSKNTYNYGTLYVPKGTKDIYIRYDGWRDFYNIVEMDETNIDVSHAYDPIIRVEDNSVIIDGIEKGGQCDIYSISGTLIHSLNSNGKGIRVDLIKGNTYIIKVGESTIKVVL